MRFGLASLASFEKLKLARLSVVAGIVMCLVATSACADTTGSSAEPTATPEPPPTATPVDELYAAMQRDLGLTTDGAKALLAHQEQAIKLDDTLPQQLGDAYAGSWFDRTSGKLIVALTSNDKSTLVTDAGGEVRIVKRSMFDLNTSMKRLDDAYDKDASAMADAISWSVDEPNNVVALTVGKGQAAKFKKLLPPDDDTVRIDESDVKPALTTGFLDGGDPFNACSVGFNVAKDNQGYFITAGHCGRVGATATQHGDRIGPFVASNVSTHDDALVRNDNTAYWQQGPWVYAYDPDHRNWVYNISGTMRSLVGTAVCKSGRTTKLTCGWITGRLETVNLSRGPVKYLTRHTACAEPGDSGGATFSSTPAGHWAQGTSVAASLIGDTCLHDKVGLFENRTWFFPIRLELNDFGVELMTV